MYRLFVAIDLPTHIKEQLTRLSGGVPGARWLTPVQMHLTLRFIGEVDGGVFEDIMAALGEIRRAPFELTLKGVGHFPPKGRPEVIWVGVQKSEPLIALRNKIESTLSHIGIERDRRKFAPHVAIARLRDVNVPRLARYIIEYNLYESLPFRVNEFCLYSSMLSSSGAIYQVEESYPLTVEGQSEE